MRLPTRALASRRSTPAATPSATPSATRSAAPSAAPGPRALPLRALPAVRGGGDPPPACTQKIEWTWTDGGITANDDWEARV